jgi:hypothetical protein
MTQFVQDHNKSSTGAVSQATKERQKEISYKLIGEICDSMHFVEHQEVASYAKQAFNACVRACVRACARACVRS